MPPCKQHLCEPDYSVYPRHQPIGQRDSGVFSPALTARLVAAFHAHIAVPLAPGRPASATMSDGAPLQGHPACLNATAPGGRPSATAADKQFK